MSCNATSACGGVRGTETALGGSSSRRPDWPEQLDAVISAARNQPFAWGTHDCVTFAAACIRAMTGVDPLAGLPVWANRRQAAQALGTAAGGGLQAAVTRAMAPLGWPSIHPVWAGRGDLVIALECKGRFAAICTGRHLAAPGPAGLAIVPIGHVSAAWRVG